MGWACEISSLVAESLFSTLGFEHSWSSHYLLSTLSRNAISKPARTFAHKAVVRDGQTYHIVCATFKGTTTTSEAVTDVKSVGDGFFEAGKNCAEALADYVHGIECAADTSTILFICGHSLGAAVANVVGRLTKDLAEDHMRFVYTYASPNYECGDDARSGYAFPNFRTFTNVDDAVPTVPATYPTRLASSTPMTTRHSMRTSATVSTAPTTNSAVFPSIRTTTRSDWESRESAIPPSPRS